MLKGKCAVVTGSTSGIGLGIAETLAASGANLMINGFGESGEIARLRDRLSAKYGVRIIYSPADMSRPAEIAAMIEQAVNGLGSVDILVNNAGIQYTAPVQEFPTERWDAIIAINLSAAFHATRAALGPMLGKRWGRIVNIASTHGLVASMHKVAYVAAKHGIIGMTKVVALETATTGITCNAVCPGWVRTPLVEAQIAELAKRENIDLDKAVARLLGEKQPSLDFATPEQIAEVVVFLCSEAAAQIRGIALPVDGGWTAQ
jgi:3-hydroxybutyrate dehydrogenase